jgi:hypothetical protein
MKYEYFMFPFFEVEGSSTMITIKNKTMIIPHEEKVIGVVGDSNSISRTFVITRGIFGEADIADLTFMLDIEYENQQTNTEMLSKTIEDSRFFLTWEVIDNDIPYNGTVLVQIRGVDSVGAVRWRTTPKGAFYVEDKIENPNGWDGGLSSNEAFEKKVDGYINAENDRAASETARKTAETARQTAETQRVQESASAIDAVNQAVSTVGPAVTEANNAIIAANDATTAALDAAEAAAAYGAGDMQKSIYDPQNKLQDIFAYAQALVDGVKKFSVLVVSELPATNIDTMTIYFLPKSAEVNNNYDEYMYIGSAWEHIGSTTIDLSNYLTKTGDSKDNTVTFTEAATDTDIVTGESHSTIFGKLLKSIKTFRASIAAINSNLSVQVINFPFASGISDSVNVSKATKYGRIVELNLRAEIATQPTAYAPVTIGTLPAGYAPITQKNPMGYNYMASDNDKIAAIGISTSGVVTAYLSETSPSLNILHLETTFISAS